jgi:dephospho-CoA kinase
LKIANYPLQISNFKPGRSFNLQFAIFILQFAISLSALAFASEAWEQLESDRASVRFRPQDRLLADRVRQDVEDACSHVCRSLRLRTAPRITVYLTSSGAEFDALTAGAVPDWGVGCALPARQTIVLRRVPGAPQGLRETVFHEVSHLLLRSAAGGLPVPTWFDEGVAMWNASEWRWGQSYEMASAALWGGLIPLHDIDAVLTFASPKARLAYAESFFAVSRLVDLAGPDAPARLLGEMGAGRAFEEAFALTVGATPEEFEARWKREARERFGPMALLSASLDFWPLVTALFLVAYVATRLRNRRTVRRWEAEEAGPIRPSLRVHEPSNPESRAMVIGVTGGLGSGKTSVCRLFEACGALVIEADRVGREVVEDPDVLEALVAAFGQDIVAEGRLDRRRLGQRAFADAAANERLNRIVWPPLVRKLRADVEAALRERPDRPVVVDAALLVEWGDLSWLDALVVVTASEQVRKTRMMARMDLSEAEVARMRAQLPEEEKARRADCVIVNDGTEEDLRAQASEVWARLTAKSV